MAEDLKNKTQKNNEIKKDNKDAKTTSSNKPEVNAASQTKANELKKNLSEPNNKKVQEVPQSAHESKKISTKKKK